MLTKTDKLLKALHYESLAARTDNPVAKWTYLHIANNWREMAK